MTTVPSAQGPTRPARWLCLALALAAALVFVEVLGQVRQLRDLVAASALTAYLLAALAGGGAARAFGRGDHLRRAWLLVGAGYLGLCLGRLLFPGDLLGLADGAALTWTRAAVTLVANVLWAAGTGHFAVTWLRTGLPLPGTPRERWLVAVVLTAAILGLVGPDLVSSVALALRGDAYAGSVAIGDTTDVVSFLLMVPVVLIARALAGGSLAWPFGLLCASDLAWLLLDGFSTYGGVLGVAPPVVQATTGALRTLACLLFAAAGVTQWRAIRALRGRWLEPEGEPGEAEGHERPAPGHETCEPTVIEGLRSARKEPTMPHQLAGPLAPPGRGRSQAQMATQPPLELIAARLAEYLGPHTARVAVKTFSIRAGPPGADPAQPVDVGALLAALRPVLRTLLGRERAELLLREIEEELR